MYSPWRYSNNQRLLGIWHSSNKSIQNASMTGYKDQQWQPNKWTSIGIWAGWF